MSKAEPIKIQFVGFDNIGKTNKLHDFLSRNFDLEINGDNPDFVICGNKSLHYRQYKCKRIFYTIERSRLDFCTYDFIFSMSPSSSKNYYLPAYRFAPAYSLLFAEKDTEKLMKEKEEFCGFLYSRRKAKTPFNYYAGVAYRNEFFHRLSAYKRVNSGAGAFNNMNRRIKGGMKNTLDFYRPRKFAIAFENAFRPGYITEKIVTAFAGGAVPIYWGDPMIREQFNPRAFINCHDYDNWDDVIKRVVEVDRNDDLYMQYLSEPAFVDNQEPEFLKEKSIASRFEQIFNSQAKPRASSWVYRPCAEIRHFQRWLVRFIYKRFKLNDGY